MFVFSPNYVLIVIPFSPTDKSPDADISPKPTIFLPSIAERVLHKAGTYLCLLEDFFPDVIKIDWKEKNGKTVLTSQQGDTMKTNDTYMKFSWLTVTGASMDKDHKCIVNHESDIGGVNQEILFPPVVSWKDSLQKANEKLTVEEEPKTKDSKTDGTPPLQLRNTSAYYTYVLLLVKSLVYSTIMAVCLLGGPALYGNGKSS
uniref:Immunoglobulin C1-set domain-containing protein n=1 Tax=Ursus americanus TaxID=9643 RepID=A0A452R9W4_URSAM